MLHKNDKLELKNSFRFTWPSILIELTKIIGPKSYVTYSKSNSKLTAEKGAELRLLTLLYHMAHNSLQLLTYFGDWETHTHTYTYTLLALPSFHLFNHLRELSIINSLMVQLLFAPIRFQKVHQLHCKYNFFW